MKDKIENALNESRILVLVIEVMVGFQYQAVFQAGFAKLLPNSQHLLLLGLALLLAALILFLSPAAYHRIVEPGRLTPTFHRFITRTSTVALAPFALAAGVDSYVVTAKVYGSSPGLAAGAGCTAAAIAFWYGIEFIVACREPGHWEEPPDMAVVRMELKDRIKFALTEARVILPGAQALLGFQFAAVLTDRFDKLGLLDKSVHLASLAAVGLSTIVLMAPAAYHRIVERGENSERLHTFASRMILTSMAFLAIGVSGDVFVVVEAVVRNVNIAWQASGITLALFLGVWFGYMLFRKCGIFGVPRHSAAPSNA